MVDVDVPPATGVVIDDLQHGLLPGKLGHIPRVPEHDLTALAVLPGASHGTANGLPSYQQIHAGLLFMLAGANQEVYELSFNNKLRRCEYPCILVTGVEVGIHQPFTFVAGHPVSWGDIGDGRAFAEGLALDLPRSVAVALEVGNENVVGADHGRKPHVLDQRGHIFCGTQRDERFRLLGKGGRATGACYLGFVSLQQCLQLLYLVRELPGQIGRFANILLQVKK